MATQQQLSAMVAALHKRGYTDNAIRLLLGWRNPKLGGDQGYAAALGMLERIRKDTSLTPGERTQLYNSGSIPGMLLGYRELLKAKTPAPPPVAPAPTPPSPPATTGPTATQRDAFAYIQGLFDEYGLGSEAPWAWTEILAGSSSDKVMQDLRQRDSWKNRFAGMELRRANGHAAITPQEYIQFENFLFQTMTSAGMPPAMASRQVAADLIGKNVSMQEVNDRVENGWREVYEAPPEVRQYFDSVYGTDSDTALAAFFIDDQVALPILEQAARTGVFGGLGKRFGFDISADLAAEAAKFGFSKEQVLQGYQQLDTQRALLNETASEDFDIDADMGAEAVFHLDQEANKRLGQRIEQRNAVFTGAGGPAQIESGVIGAGKARRGRV